MRRTYGVLVLALAVAAGACGGGGGGGGVEPVPPEATVYRYADIAAFGRSDPPVCAASFGGMAFSDAGDASTNLTRNEDGAIDGPTAGSGLRYTLDADGTLRVIVPELSPAPYVQGGANPALGVGLFATELETAPPRLAALLRRGGTFPEAIEGDFHWVSWAYDTATNELFGIYANGTFGPGTWGGSGTVNRNGDASAMIQIGTYTRTSTGDLFLRTGSTELRGGFLPGDTIGIAGGDATALGTPRLQVLVRASTSANAATLRGTYHLGILAASGLGITSIHGTLTSDGAGNLTWTGQPCVEGRMLDPGSGTATYGVLPTGQLNVGVGAATTLRGAVTSDGAFAVVGGPVNDGTLPAIWILVRRP